MCCLFTTFALFQFAVADTPDKPGVPEIVDYDSNFVELAWSEPSNNGGSPITDYIIEAKTKFTTIWSKVAKVGLFANSAFIFCQEQKF